MSGICALENIIEREGIWNVDQEKEIGVPDVSALGFQLNSTPKSRSLSSSAEKPASTSAVALRLSRVSSSMDNTQLHLCFTKTLTHHFLWFLVLLKAGTSILLPSDSKCMQSSTCLRSDSGTQQKKHRLCTCYGGYRRFSFSTKKIWISMLWYSAFGGTGRQRHFLACSRAHPRYWPSLQL